MSFFSELFGKSSIPPHDDGPFMEYPSNVLDAVFQKHFGIQPHDDEDDDAVGAEW